MFKNTNTTNIEKYLTYPVLRSPAETHSEQKGVYLRLLICKHPSLSIL